MKPCPYVDPTPNGLILVHGFAPDPDLSYALDPPNARHFAELLTRAADRAEALRESPPGSTTTRLQSPSESLNLRSDSTPN